MDTVDPILASSKSSEVAREHRTSVLVARGTHVEIGLSQSQGVAEQTGRQPGRVCSWSLYVNCAVQGHVERFGLQDALQQHQHRRQEEATLTHAEAVVNPRGERLSEWRSNPGTEDYQGHWQEDFLPSILHAYVGLASRSQINDTFRAE